MNPKNSIIESLGYILVTIAAAAATYFGGTVAENLDVSTVGGRIEALPLLNISLVLGNGYSVEDMHAAVYIGGFVIYFLVGLVILSLIHAAIKRYGKKGGGGSGPII